MAKSGHTPVGSDHSAVIVGRFNPAILSPQWIAENVFEASEEIQVEVATTLDSSSVVYRLLDISWAVAADHLRVSGSPERIGELSAKVLELLPHTPVNAAGVNFTLAGRLSPPKIGPDRLERSEDELSKLLGGEPRVPILTESAQRPDGVRVSVKIFLLQNDRAAVDFNYHIDASGHGLERSSSLVRHVTQAPRFFEDAQRIAKSIFND